MNPSRIAKPAARTPKKPAARSPSAKTLPSGARRRTRRMAVAAIAIDASVKTTAQAMLMDAACQAGRSSGSRAGSGRLVASASSCRQPARISWTVSAPTMGPSGIGSSTG